jgi:hypothetical protein
MSLSPFSTTSIPLQWHIVIIKEENIQTQTRNFISVYENWRETECLSHIKCFNCKVQKHEGVKWLCIIHNGEIMLPSYESVVRLWHSDAFLRCKWNPFPDLPTKSNHNVVTIKLKSVLYIRLCAGNIQYGFFKPHIKQFSLTQTLSFCIRHAAIPLRIGLYTGRDLTKLECCIQHWTCSVK